VGGEQHERSECWAREGECPGVKAEQRQLGERWVLSATSVSTLYLIRSPFRTEFELKAVLVLLARGFVLPVPADRGRVTSVTYDSS